MKIIWDNISSKALIISHIFDPIPGSPIGRFVETALGYSTLVEAYDGFADDAMNDLMLMFCFGGGNAFKTGAVKFAKNLNKSFIRCNRLLRKAQIRRYERSIGKLDTNLNKYSQVHHVVPQSSSTNVQKLFDKSGMEINDSQNLLRLPTKKGSTMKEFKNATIHQGRHCKKYVENIEEEVQKILRDGEKFNYSQAKFKSELLKLIDKTKGGLISGDIPLNSVVRAIK